MKTARTSTATRRPPVQSPVDVARTAVAEWAQGIHDDLHALMAGSTKAGPDLYEASLAVEEALRGGFARPCDDADALYEELREAIPSKALKDLLTRYYEAMWRDKELAREARYLIGVQIGSRLRADGGAR